MSSWHDYVNQNHDMIDKFTRLAIISSKEVENAFRCVIRAAFLSKELLEEAYVDAPIRGAPHIHMSAPHMYAAILEDLELEPGMSFLNIGSGTGYFSCLAGYMLKHHGINHGVELHEDLVQFSKSCVSDFLAKGPPDAKEICPPLFISGNCFQLDPSQLKYDRLYCGGSCSQSTVRFFLDFLKVGGFLIAPVGTKLIKLERVSHKEGVKTVISDVCFAPLIRLEAHEITKLKLGLLPLLRFPIKTKKQKPKKTIFASTNFPVSHSPARKKISKLRALQHILDTLEYDNTIPLPLCYVPQLDQMNAYKQYKKVIECRSPAKNPNADANTSAISKSESPMQAQDTSGNSLNPPTSNNNPSTPSPLMTIQEFLLAASPPSVFDEFFGTSTRNENRGTTETQTERSAPQENSSETRERLNESIRLRENFFANVLSQNRPSVELSGTRNVTVIDKRNNSDFDIGDKISKDMWEHLCYDKLWETVVDYYYSVCSTTSERRKKCFELKGVEIVNPATAKLADVLLFKMQKSKTKSNKNTDHNSNGRQSSTKNICDEERTKNICDEERTKSICDEEHKCLGSTVISSSKAASSSSCNENGAKTLKIQEDESIPSNVKQCLEDLVDSVCLQVEKNDLVFDEASNLSNESLDSILTLPSSLNCTADSSLMDNVLDAERPCCSSPSVSTKLKKKSKYVDIRTDNMISELLSHVPQEGWTVEHDVQLISFLVTQGKDCEVFSLRDNLPKVVREDLFEKSKLIKYPLLSSFPPIAIAYRSIALVRIAKILDLVLDVLVGPSLDRNQFNNPFVEKYPLPSFSESSFHASDSQLNVLEAQKFKDTYPCNYKEDAEKPSYQNAKSLQDEELLKEVESMISYEMNNVKQQQLILARKLELIDNIDEQYKEQIKLLNQQVDLIEEQQRLLYEVNVDAGCNQVLASQLTSSQQMVTDRKQQRQALITKRDRIVGDRTLQLAERKELLSMLEQLLSLETRLRNELKSLSTKGMGYLRGHGNDLSNFSQFVQKAEKILRQLKTSNNKVHSISEEKKVPESSKTKEIKKKPVLRYEPSTILPRCRFLLPLSKKRYSFIKEMLRSTERPAPRHMPIINVDRRIPINERHAHGKDCTIFMQIFLSLKNKDLHYRWNKKAYEQWWEVKFSGEGIIDQGGGFRDSLTEISEELCPLNSDLEMCLPLFIRTPNQSSGLGEYLDCYTLNPQCQQLHLYNWLGQLMGACFRSDESIPLALPPMIWKLLVGEHVSWKQDFIHIDEAAVKNIDGLENLDEDAYVGLNIEQTYTTVLSDGSGEDLLPNGSEVVVECYDRSTYSQMARTKRMMECCKQLKAIRGGLLLVIPDAVLSCLTWKNLERGICGDPCISISDLEANCRYGDDLKATSQCVVYMWTSLASFTDDERSRFIRFVTGRKRLPSPFLVSRSSADKDNLPSASTCGSNLFLPEYSSLQIAKEKLRYAIYNCVAIDTDTSPW